MLVETVINKDALKPLSIDPEVSAYVKKVNGLFMSAYYLMDDRAISSTEYASFMDTFTHGYNVVINKYNILKPDKIIARLKSLYAFMHSALMQSVRRNQCKDIPLIKLDFSTCYLDRD